MGAKIIGNYIKLSFSKHIYFTGLSSDSIRLLGEDKNIVKYYSSYNKKEKSIILTPKTKLKPGKLYKLSIVMNNVYDLCGNMLETHFEKGLFIPDTNDATPLYVVRMFQDKRNNNTQHQFVIFFSKAYDPSSMIKFWPVDEIVEWWDGSVDDGVSMWHESEVENGNNSGIMPFFVYGVDWNIEFTNNMVSNYSNYTKYSIQITTDKSLEKDCYYIIRFLNIKDLSGKTYSDEIYFQAD
jgi:hypothetical protein